MSLSALWAELREFIRRLRLAEDEQRSLRRDLLALANDMRDAWMEDVVLPPAYTATISGQVDGCNAFGFPGATITIKDQLSGATLATATCDSGGAYTASFPLTTNPQLIVFNAAPAGADAAKFTGGSQTQSIANGSNTVGTIAMGIASGYTCYSQCSTYVPGILPPSFTFTYGGTSWTVPTNGTPVSGAINGSVFLLGQVNPAPPPDCGGGSNPVLVKWSISLATLAGVSTWILDYRFTGLCCAGLPALYDTGIAIYNIILAGPGAANCTNSPVSVTLPTTWDVAAPGPDTPHTGPCAGGTTVTLGGGGSISLVP